MLIFNRWFCVFPILTVDGEEFLVQGWEFQVGRCSLEPGQRLHVKTRNLPINQNAISILKTCASKKMNQFVRVPQGGKSGGQKVGDRDVALEGRAMRPRQFET